MGAPGPEPAVTATPAALEAIAGLLSGRGAVLFYQSGGCCDGSLPMCFEKGEFLLAEQDVLLGEVGGCPFFIDFRQHEAWKHTQLILDVGEGEPEGFSLPAAEGKHFITRSRVCAGPLTGPIPWRPGPAGTGCADPDAGQGLPGGQPG